MTACVWSACAECVGWGPTAIESFKQKVQLPHALVHRDEYVTSFAVEVA